MQDGDGDDIIQSDNDSDRDQGDQEKNPLMVPLDEEVQTREEITNKWFSQDIFAETVEEGDLGDDSDNEMQVDRQEEKLSVPKKSEEKLSVPKKSEEKAANPTAGSDRPKLKASKADDDFEVVPAPGTDSSDDSSSDESEDEDVYRKAEILACAKKMLRKKQREQMLDDAYNKYMFHDDGLPNWFLDEERRHRQQIKPVTKEEVAAIRAQFKEIDARPGKKVAEAKARKKRVAQRKLEGVRKKANVISDQADINDRSKRKQIEQLYKKAMPKRAKKELVVAKKGVQVKAGKGKVLVDPRMKKDKRTRGMGGKPGKGGKGKNVKAQKGKGAQKGEGSQNSSAKKGKKGSRGKKMGHD